MSTPVTNHDAFAEHAPEVLFRVVNRVALITLNRPAALNALSYPMIGELAALLERCRDDDQIVAVVLRGAGEKGFCAGGDVRALYRMVAQRETWLPFFVDEYRLDYAIHTFPKPVVALMDGVTMGGGMGLAQGAALRVATERSKIAMPETRIGLVPDVGATHFLSRMPAELELYVGLTGAMLSGADALTAKLADLCVPSAWLDTFETRIESVKWEGDALPLLRKVFEPPCNVVPHAALDSQMPWIVRHFDKRSTVERIVATLTQDLARGAVARAPSMAAGDTRCAHRPFADDAVRDPRGTAARPPDDAGRIVPDGAGIVARAIEEGDFCEGVRAHLVDKDRKPRWAPASLVELRAERVRHFLTSPWKLFAHPLADLGAA